MTRPIHRPFNRPTVAVRTRPITGRESIEEFLARGGAVTKGAPCIGPPVPEVRRMWTGIVADLVSDGDGNRRHESLERRTP